MSNIWSREPARIVAAAATVIALAVKFGLPIKPDQVSAILEALAILLPLFIGEVVRSQVSSPTTVAAIRAGDDPAKRPPNDPPGDDTTPHVIMKQSFPSKPPGPPGAAAIVGLCLLLAGCTQQTPAETAADKRAAAIGAKCLLELKIACNGDVKTCAPETTDPIEERCDRAIDAEYDQ